MSEFKESLHLLRPGEPPTMHPMSDEQAALDVSRRVRLAVIEVLTVAPNHLQRLAEVIARAKAETDVVDPSAIHPVSEAASIMGKVVDEARMWFGLLQERCNAVQAAEGSSPPSPLAESSPFPEPPSGDGKSMPHFEQTNPTSPN